MTIPVSLTNVSQALTTHRHGGSSITESHYSHFPFSKVNPRVWGAKVWWLDLELSPASPPSRGEPIVDIVGEAGGRGQKGNVISGGQRSVEAHLAHSSQGSHGVGVGVGRDQDECIQNKVI